MRLFGRNLKQQIVHVEDPYKDEDQENEPAPQVEDRDSGPFDISEKDVSKGYVDLGSLKLPMRNGMNIQMEVSDKTRQILSVSVVIGQSSLQLQAFSAPKTLGIWDEIREALIDSLKKQNADILTRDGQWGGELVAQVAAKTSDGRVGKRIARFVGVDGPRWFVRAVFAGRAAMEGPDADTMEEFLSEVVVDRGSNPMAPRELLPLKPPPQMPQRATSVENTDSPSDESGS